MGLKFQREDSLDKMFDEFAILPDIDKDNKKQQNDIERFLEKENDENKKAEKTKEPKKAD
ncbi:SPJ_0845 family protein [Enterococcus sp.]|uniref:SPJ_0845 family protein n=1 Tax=Enterococcus sp. TaxID=35783 RepID=UPI0025BA9959|nr:SPJ_0845 family protein [Enterococcus sp.]